MSDEFKKVDNVPRLRTVSKCYEAIRAIDPDTVVTEWYIRRLCKHGKIICYGSGNKSLVNLDSLLAYLNKSLEEINKEKIIKE